MGVSAVEQLRELALLITAVTAAAGVAWRMYRKFDAVVEGLRCQLRSDMLQVYYHHKDEKRIRQYEMENFEHNYAAYTALGGNSFIGNVHEEVCSWEVVT